MSAQGQRGSVPRELRRYDMKLCRYMHVDTISVQQLIDLLMAVPNKDVPVYAEGCDCDGEAGSIEVEGPFTDHPDGAVTVKRATGKLVFETEEEN